jgi:hypothetical protein
MCLVHFVSLCSLLYGLQGVWEGQAEEGFMLLICL